jgi:2-polyprenyl-6-methoxyphenol hydroxylase-like FAD-dependent oxidoreductase
MTRQTGCCIVGGGPAGVVLSLLLARRGVSTSLLEAKDDFDRAFRGDTVHPSTLEMLHDLRLAEPLLTRAHGTLRRMTLHSGKTAAVLADFSRLRSRFPFIAMIPQAEFLDFIAGEAQKHACFELRMAARVTDLIIEDDQVRGVRYRDGQGDGELRASLTIAADGRASRLRRLAGFTPKKNAAAMDVMWLVLPRRDNEPATGMTGFRVGRGRLVVVLVRADQWQLGYVILKGDKHGVREAGLDALRTEVAALVPELADRVDTIRDWNDVHFLSVESSRVPTWHRPGLLVIGDAAHVMSPVGGVGINYAIQDAVAAANLLADPLLDGNVSDAHLRAVQRRREFPTRFIQGFQSVVQRLLVDRALDDRPFRLPLPARILSSLPLFRNIPARLVGWGLRPERVQPSALESGGRAT